MPLVLFDQPACLPTDFDRYHRSIGVLSTCPLGVAFVPVAAEGEERPKDLGSSVPMVMFVTSQRAYFPSYHCLSEINK